ncbi:GGDEF domain-containing protein [Agrobacterium sp. a22-2]|uniref:GGDEF domain-containing protein n=1 Tax=Agrobacterium sp. a22-2 TaxID=2283840 RepID=UPI00144565E8|nr:GGDEF domain-containing protein [Agrobacterium sp. a22-2]NKN38568.1 GGDEF domain-containing protein [Agrobacterium sp. a22-2]
MLDLLTIVTYNAVINLVIAIIAAIAWWRHRQQKDIIYWLLTTWFMVLGAVCTSMTELLPYNILGYVGGTIYVTKTGFMCLGFKAFYGQSHKLREAFYVSAPVLAVLIGASALDDPSPTRISLIYLGSAINLALCAQVLWRAGQGERLPSGRLAVFILAVYAGANVLISPLAILYPVQFVGRIPVSDWMSYTSILLLIFNVLSFLMVMVLKLERSGEIQRQLAERDALTGVANRRTFLREAARLEKAGEMAIAIIDLDHFKVINDTFGHKGGDDALIQFVARVGVNLPAGAVFGRLGGEEFGICLPGHDRNAARGVLEAVRDAIARMEVRSDNHKFGLTMSCGYTVTDGRIRSLDAWMADADMGLYAAKNNGRNCVIAYRPEMALCVMATPATGAASPMEEPSRLMA